MLNYLSLGSLILKPVVALITIVAAIAFPGFANSIHNDASYPWQIGFQDGATPSFEGIVELHDSIFFYLIVISVLVTWMLGSVLIHFNSNRALIVHKYHNHGTLIELVWTITPALLLIAIAFPSFKLLYLMDTPAVALAVVPLLKVKAKHLKSSSTSLVPFGCVGATTNIVYNRMCFAFTVFPARVMSQLVGHLLGDGSLNLTHTSVNPYFIFTQTLKRFAYTWSVFQSLSHYCIRTPLLNKAKRKGVSVPFTQVMTRSYPALLPLYNLFYSNPSRKGVGKVITWDIYPYLNDVSLAYWAMDDGAWTSSGFYLHTSGFTFNEVYLLAAMLHYRFGIVCTVQTKQSQPVLYITTKSMTDFRRLVTPHFHPTMMYKLRATRALITSS